MADRVLIEFKAGKMVLDGKTLKPDARKGLLRVTRTEDGLVRLQWLERTEGGPVSEPEVDTIVFPEEAQFEKVKNTAQRVYILNFPQETDRNMFFWMQEPSADKDTEICNKLNQGINQPEDVDMGGAAEEEDEVPEVFMNAVSSGLERAHQSTRPGTGMEVVQGSSVGLMPGGAGQLPAESPSNPRDLAAMLSTMMAVGLGQPGPGPAAAAAAGGTGDYSQAAATALLAQLASRRRVVAEGPSLADLLKPEVLAPLLQDHEVLSRLAHLLPSEHQNVESLSALAHSPQFHQQLHSFSAALQTGQLDLAQFGLSAQGFTVADFLSAIEDLVHKEAREGSGSGQPPQGGAGMEQ